MKILLVSPNTVYATARLKEEALKQKVTIEQYSARDFVEKEVKINVADFDALYVRFAYPYFKEIGGLIKQFKVGGKRVVDEVLNETNLDLNKLVDNRMLREKNVITPKTFEYVEFSKLNFPLVAKIKHGFGKKEVELCHNEAELKNFVGKFKESDVLVQDFIPAVYEYKVITVGYKSLAKVLKFKSLANEFGINPLEYEVLSRENCKEVCALAEKAAQVLGKELAKTDIVESQGKFYVIEVNRSPGFQSFEKLSGENVAGEFMAYLKQNWTK